MPVAGLIISDRMTSYGRGMEASTETMSLCAWVGMKVHPPGSLTLTVFLVFLITRHRACRGQGVAWQTSASSLNSSPGFEHTTLLPKGLQHRERCRTANSAASRHVAMGIPVDRPMITCIPTFSHTCKAPGDASGKPSKGAKNPWEICGLTRRLDLNKD